MKFPSQLSIVLLVAALLLSACQAISASPSGSVSSLADETAARGTVRIGVRNDNPPLSFVTEEGEWVGFDVDLAHAIAAQLNLEPELIVVDGTTRISFLQEGRVDMSIASMNHTRKRDNAIDFSITYFWDNQSFLVRTGEYTAIEELMGKKVAANAGSSAIPSWIAHSAALGGPEPEIVEFSDKLAAMQALRDGAVEGYTEDNITMLALAAGDPALELLPGGHNPVQFGIGVPNNQSAWRDQVNYALQEQWKSGVFHEIYAHWFEGPDAPIQLPLGGQMEIWPE